MHIHTYTPLFHWQEGHSNRVPEEHETARAQPGHASAALEASEGWADPRASRTRLLGVLRLPLTSTDTLQASISWMWALMVAGSLLL